MPKTIKRVGDRPAHPEDMSSARVETVNVVHAIRAGYYHDTAIDKRPQTGRVRVTELGLAGDRQMDPTHGGPDKAVYAYAREDAEWWSAELGLPVPPGLFGENLRTSGLDVSSALIGECWQVGDVVLQVRMPRTPCQNLSLRVGVDGFHRRFNSSGRVGALLAVVQPGYLTAGDPIAVVERPDHQVTVADLSGRPSADAMRSLLDSGVSLASKVSARARRVASRG